MKNKIFKALRGAFCAFLSAVVVFVAICFDRANVDIGERFDSTKKMSYTTSYKTLSAKRKNKKSLWRQGMVSGNGLQGFVTSGSPYSDTLIYQNMHFIMPGQHQRYTPDTSDELETVKQCIIKGEDIVDNSSYDDVYYFHPGGVLRVDQKKHIAREYYRYTNYETAEVGVSYKDINGAWERKSFTSQTDGVNITEIKESSKGEKVNITLSYDPISTIANYGDGDERAIQYKNIVNDGADTIAMVAHYPDYENSELKNGGYATLTYIVLKGGSATKTEGRAIGDEQYAGKSNPQIKIENADAVYLISLTGRTYDMGAFDEFKAQESYAIFDELRETAQSVAKRYENAENGFDYDAALSEHTKVFTPIFDAVDFNLGDTESDKSNDYLIHSQMLRKTLKSDFIEKLYYSGRYAYVCCCGYSTSRLAGLWTGEYNPGWGSKYTMDANVNLQTSSMNSSNISIAPIGYTYFILRQVDDWEQNAEATHGYKEAIQAPVHEDGDCAALTETCYPYPFRYWNAGASWMLQPLFETLETYGNIQIPLSSEFNLNDLKSVLSTTDEDLTDAQIAEIQSRGYLMLKEDVLLPLLIKSANYWIQLMTPEYYTDSNGDIHYEQGKSALADGEYFCILPSYSPENNPKNYPSPSDANCAIDISACRDNMRMLIEVMTSIDSSADVSAYQYVIDKLPPYLFDETGALKEWACNQFEENNEHRHLSHLYCVWPLDETQNDEELKNACIQAIVNRESENEASHALVHRSLIAARLKDRDLLTDALLNLVNHRIHYKSLMTNHDYDRGSAYCTDFAIGYLGIINESLLYSNPGVIEALPSMPTSGFESGSISGLKTRTNAEITNMKWTDGECQVTVKSDVEQDIIISCGLFGSEQSVHFAAGEEKTLDFNKAS